jgi:hypothetical protein
MQPFFGETTLAVCAFLGLLVVPGCGGAVPAPTAFATYNAPNGRFACDYPKGWEVTGSKSKPDSPLASAAFTMGNAEIKVAADLAGSLFGDIARSAGSMGGNDEPPVAKVHPMGVRSMKDEYSNYEEREATAFKSRGLGEGRRSIFIADQALGGKIYGYRATLLSGDRRITVVCSCPATNWKALKPAFEKVIDSLSLPGR